VLAHEVDSYVVGLLDDSDRQNVLAPAKHFLGDITEQVCGDVGLQQLVLTEPTMRPEARKRFSSFKIGYLGQRPSLLDMIILAGCRYSLMRRLENFRQRSGR
jgi:hypothetical protein